MIVSHGVEIHYVKNAQICDVIDLLRLITCNESHIAAQHDAILCNEKQSNHFDHWPAFWRGGL